jgi:shikimate dehydrogenase
MIQLGLIGKDLTHSFSGRYFSEKFENASISGLIEYRLFEIPSISHLSKLLDEHPDLAGFNVTIPYKEPVLPFLDIIDSEAAEIGAVNTVNIERHEKGSKNILLKGFNTDAPGFEFSLLPLLKPWHKKALVLGSGGASKAICHVLKKLNIEFLLISRNPQNVHAKSYSEIDRQTMSEHLLIINTTPIGTFPNVNECPDLPYQLISDKHLLYDLVYNPEETLFLQKGKNQRAVVKNGHEMLERQAELSWKIWNASLKF